MLTFKYRNMKFSRNDLPLRKAPEKSKNQQIIYFLCQLSIPHFLTATLYIRETCVDFYVCITCHRYDADGFVSDVVLVQDFIESFLVQEELVRLALIVNLHNLYRLPHDNAGQNF